MLPNEFLQKGKLFEKEEIDKVVRVLENLGKEIKNEGISFVFEEVLEILRTVEEDRILTMKEKSEMIEIVNKNKGGKKPGFDLHDGGAIDKTEFPLLSHFASRADIEEKNNELAKECYVCSEVYDQREHKQQLISCHPEHTLCKSCFSEPLMRKNGKFICPICKKIAYPIVADSEMSVWMKLLLVFNALFGVWFAYISFWKISPESLDFFGFCQTVVGSIVWLLIILWALGR
jgi:Zn finger protein HypA/HybF involved in hydrogenase expression